MLIGVIADDFTGASDIANTLAKGVPPEGGLRTAQYAGLPNQPAERDIEAGVISLKSRSAPKKDAVRESLEALNWLCEQGYQQIVFKYCSTFDSTPEGNIGPVGEALSKELNAYAAVVCPAFPEVGRTVYQGHLFVADSLLNESGMQHHPLTPMTDADIRRWLERQCNSRVGHVASPTVKDGKVAISEKLARLRGDGCLLAVVDATSDNDLLSIGEAVADAPLVTGASGIALGLPRNFIRKDLARGGKARSVSVSGSEAILAGSCSGATRGQVEEHTRLHPTMPIDVPGVMNGVVTPKTLVDFIEANPGRAPLAYSSGSPNEVKALQARFGREEVAYKLDTLFAETARNLIERGYRRIVVAGGETSGAVAKAVVEALSSPAMHIGPEIDPGVPVLTLGGEEPVALALKSGNFGARDFFVKALRVMHGPSVTQRGSR